MFFVANVKSRKSGKPQQLGSSSKLMEGDKRMKVSKRSWIKWCAIAIITLFVMTPLASAQTPPYVAGGAGQWTQGNASVWNTGIFLNNGTFTMLGISGAAGLVTSGRADNWGYMEVRTTAPKTGTLHAYTYVAFNGHVQMYCYVIWIGSASCAIWIMEKIRVYDITNNWQNVGETYVWVYNNVINYAGSASRTFDPSTPYYVSIDVNCVAGHSYAIDTWVECQCASQAALGGVAQSSYSFATSPPSLYIKVNSINWYFP